MSAPRIVLIAKPWRGGLAEYLLRALVHRYGEHVRWIPSYPHTAAELLRYRLSKTAWRNRLLERIQRTPRDAALFVNLPPGAQHITPDPGNVLWLTDAPRPDAAELAGFERIFTSDAGHAGAVREAAPPGSFAGSVPFACDPAVHRQLSTTVRRDVCFIGNRDAGRDAHLAALLACGASATVVGNYFARHPLFWRAPSSFRPRVAPRRMSAIYARHRMSLNVHAEVVREGTNMRTFEAAACGIAQLVDTRPGLAELFEPEREIQTYSDAAELAAGLARLLAAPELRQRLARQARRRALAEHTYDHRVRTLLAGIL